MGLTKLIGMVTKNSELTACKLHCGQRGGAAGVGCGAGKILKNVIANTAPELKFSNCALEMSQRPSGL